MTRIFARPDGTFEVLLLVAFLVVASCVFLRLSECSRVLACNSCLCRRVQVAVCVHVCVHALRVGQHLCGCVAHSLSKIIGTNLLISFFSCHVTTNLNWQFILNCFRSSFFHELKKVPLKFPRSIRATSETCDLENMRKEVHSGYPEWTRL